MRAILREELVAALPYGRRYARALLRDQAAGDAIVVRAVQQILTSVSETDGVPPRIALYQAISSALPPEDDVAAEASVANGGSGDIDTATTGAVAGMPLRQRQLLLLTSLESLPLSAAADVLGLDMVQAQQDLVVARRTLREASASSVLIIEDEPIIAMDLEVLVTDCGHQVVGLASSEAEAIEIALREKPGLILADVNLGSGGDGIAAAARIIKEHNVPVIFVTAYPERLLSGEALEPAFIITKPFDPMALAIATYQAVAGSAGRLP